MALEDSRLNQTIIIPRFHSPPHFFFLLSVLRLITLHCSQKLEECAFISLLPSRKSPFMSIRSEFKLPRAAPAVTLCITVQNYHKTHKATVT